MPGTPAALCLTQPQYLLIFTEELWGLFFLALKYWAGMLGVKLRPFAPQEGAT